jgi:hypothetical protein
MAWQPCRQPYSISGIIWNPSYPRLFCLSISMICRLVSEAPSLTTVARVTQEKRNRETGLARLEPTQDTYVFISIGVFLE